jgi:peptidoglycan/LPS O-acetylase OafA/YrhL
LLALWSQTESYRLFEPKGLKKSPWAALVVLGILVVGLVTMPSKALQIIPLPVGMVALISVVLVWLASYNGPYILPFAPLRKILCWVGSRSYAIYLIHIPAFYAVRETLYRAGSESPEPVLVVFFALAGIFLLSDINYRFIEQPLRKKGAAIADRFKRGSAKEFSTEAKTSGEPQKESMKIAQ